MRIILTFLYREIICRPLHFDCCIIPHTHQHSYFVTLRCCTANIVYLQHAELSSTVSKTYWATLRRQAPLSTASCCASSQVMPLSFRSRCTVSIQLMHGLPGFLFISLEPQNMACLGCLLAYHPSAKKVSQPYQPSFFYDKLYLF